MKPSPFLRHASCPLLVGLLAGVLAARLRWSYVGFLEEGSLQFLYLPAESHPSFGTSKLAQLRMPAVNLSEEELRLWNRRGYAVVRGAVPREAILELAAATREKFGKQKVEVFSPQHQANFFMRVFWLGLENGGAFADFFLHKDIPLGGLAGQLLSAKSVRLGNLGMNGVSLTAPGSKWHLDIGDFFNQDRERRPMDSALVRFWLPLWPDEVRSNTTGGGLAVLPLEEEERYNDTFGEAHGPCFQEFYTVEGDAQAASFDMTDHCRSWMQGRTRTIDASVGDIVLYSPKVWHRSQPVTQGDRVAITGHFYDPDALAPIINPRHADEWPQGHDVLGVLWSACVDLSRRVRHRSNYWQSAEGMRVSEASACFPQVYPSVLEDEVQDLALGRVKPGSQSWWLFMVAKRAPLLMAAHELEYRWWSVTPASFREPTKALAYTSAELLWPLFQRVALLS